MSTEYIRNSSSDSAFLNESGTEYMSTAADFNGSLPLNSSLTQASILIQPNSFSCHSDPGLNETFWNGLDASCIDITPIEAVICVVLALLILAIIIGNVFVILSVAIFDKMRTLSNWLIVSLASADLLVAIVVLPISLHNEVIGQWTLGPYICDLWITSDVFCCTASILNIVVIALDRYWLITRHVRYTHSALLPRRKVCLVMLCLAWIVSALISTSPLLGWRRGTEKLNPSECLISQDYSYTIFSTFGAFWLPLVVILAVYFKIFHFARQRATRRTKPYDTTFAEASVAMETCNETPFPVATVATSRADQLTVTFCEQDTGGNVTSPDDPATPNADATSPLKRTHDVVLPDAPTRGVTRFQVTGHDLNFRPPLVQSRSSKHRSRSMRRSARTLGLIIGGFLVCWMPFFLVATVDPFCPDCQVPRVLHSFVLWLGYSNSLLNPAIYAIWDKSFRRSFKRLASCDIR